MSLIVVLLAVVLLAVTLAIAIRWSYLILLEEERYLRAVSPLGSSPGFNRLAGTVVSLTAHRHRVCGRRLPRNAARAIGGGTGWAMGARAFEPSWVLGHRMLHRHRRSHWRIPVLMTLLAAMGSVVAAASTAASGPNRYRSGR